MRSTHLAGLILLAAGCATAGTPELQTDQRGGRVRITGVDGQRYETAVGDSRAGTRAEVAAPPDAVWARIPAVYEALGLEINAGDTGSRILGVENLRLRSIDGARPSQYLECGQGVTGANADSYDVYLTLLTQVVPGEGGGSGVVVLVEALARSGAHGGPGVGCASNGRLEERLIETLEGLVAGSSG